jgi:outer membrane autotransporter protein
VTPEVSLAYLQERQEEFAASDGDESVAVDAQRLLLGRFVLKPSFAYPVRLGETALLPYARPQLIWDFKRAGMLALDGQLATQDTLRGATEFGLRATWPRGVTGGVSVTYDGIGQRDFEAVAVSVGLAFAF